MDVTSPTSCKGLFLMQIRRKINFNVRERVISAIPVSKWKLNGKKRAFKNTLIFRKQTINDSMEEWCGDRKGGFQKIFDALLKLL